MPNLHVYIYLLTMLSLPETPSGVCEKFLQGYHAVRRSDRFGLGLSTGLVIEHVLMKSIKSYGGLTRGRVWVMSMNACAGTNEAMQ